MNLNYDPITGLIPVIIQNDLTSQVLMLGYMNDEAFQETVKENKVTFFSRSKQRLWTKGEASGNFLNVISIQKDCDQDTLLIRALPDGPTCHTGSTTCFNEETAKGTLYELQNTIQQRIDNNDPSSYTNQLFRRGINKVAQKVGEEAIEVVIEAKDNNEELFLNESADLVYHLLILLKAKGTKLEDVEGILRERME